ncbi:DNA-binding SARP family transcriptional activator [Kibdelosporangium banguiense]|uniref:DNA-binding SARP family transcriptional activator n=1 Tax=Kibdelosporangium banguiense TaxID=1365924 RepID=A0ABS4T9S5_9PSEU|nr:BTAD domain-containing putative transcriptional regulator [Kibdelosporangium banguiense]MBP2321182.1 DNA-binding SARP family transcriptional activator [Kibdelosporangium banguiense]
MEFGLLGAVVAHGPDGTVQIGHSRQSSVLAALLFDANRPVSADQLLDRVWGDRPPQTARGTLSTYLTRLRQALAPVPIERNSGGYQITVEPGALDLDRFTDLITRARDTRDDQLAARTYELAFDLWRGEPLPGLDTPWANDMRALLHRQRYAAELDYTDVRLRLSEHGSVLAELTTRAARHPLDERLAGQLILAQYRSGRLADAVEYYQQFQQRLTDELGADPGPQLRELHQRILAADEIVLAPEPGNRPRPPRQLPAPPRPFTGRAAELIHLSDRLDSDASTVVISAIGGGGGIGKTSLALHWAHLHADRFPDGQLFVNLRGFDPSSEPTPPTTALRGFLAALGVAPKDIPADHDAQAGLYRSLVADRQMLVVLDNAADTAQVVPLLAGSPAVLTLVTSRRPLTGLIVTHGAQAVPLDVLTSEEAHDLLAGRLGRARLAAEPAAVAQLVQHCGGLPLALGIVAARAIVSGLPLAELAEQLAAHRLDVLDAGEANLNLRAVFALSHRALAPETARLACLLGVAPGPDIAVVAVDVLTGQNAAGMLAELEAAHLVTQATPGRYRMHDLVRLDAVERAAALPADVRETALHRLINYYITTAQAADRLLAPARPPVELTEPGDPLIPLHDQAEAMAWMTPELACLTAAQQLAADLGWHSKVWELSLVTDTFRSRRGALAEHLSVLRAAVAATEAAGDLRIQTRLHANFGQVTARAGMLTESVRSLERVAELATRTGDIVMRAHAHNSMAESWGHQGDNHRALHHASQALALYRAAGNQRFEANALNQTGWVLALLGHYDEARTNCEAGLKLQHELGSVTGEIQDSLGYIEEHSGRFAEAVSWYREAIAVFEVVGDTYNIATTLIQLGRACAAIGHTADAEAAWRRALQLCRAQQRRNDVANLERLLG